MPSSRTSWQIRRRLHAAPLDKEEPRSPYTRSSENYYFHALGSRDETSPPHIRALSRGCAWSVSALAFTTSVRTTGAEVVPSTVLQGHE